MTLREQELTRQLEESRRENALLRQKIDWLVRRVFGSSSEALAKNQLELLMQMPVPPPVPAAVRAHQSQSIVARIQRVILHLRRTGKHLPQSLLGQAMDYALGQWSTLDVYLANGKIEIDNNLVNAAWRN
jgi:hypothetical protein